LIRVAALDTDSSFWPDGESAEPSGPWKPCEERATEMWAPAGRIAQPDGVRGVRRFAASAGAGADARPASTSRRGTREAGLIIGSS
jgi:hypothetical protein